MPISMLRHWWRSGGIPGAAVSLAVTTMGAGILTLPSAFAAAGVVPATAILLFMALLTVYSIDCLVLCIDQLGLNSYEEITGELLGFSMQEVIRWMYLVYNLGSAIGYLVVLQDLFEPLLPIIIKFVPWLSAADRVLVVFWTVVILPLSCVPTIGSLNLSSVFAIFSTTLMAIMVVWHFFLLGNDPQHLVASGVSSPTQAPEMALSDNSTSTPYIRQEARWWSGPQVLLALTIVMFSFDCQSLVFQIYAGLEDMRRRTMMRVASYSVAITAFLHLVVGVFGYLSFPARVQDNVISNYDPNTNPFVALVYFMYATPMLLAFVMLLFPTRDSIFMLWFGYSSASAATHVPRRKDYVRLVQEQERLEQMSEASSRQQPSAKLTLLHSGERIHLLGSQEDERGYQAQCASVSVSRAASLHSDCVHEAANEELQMLLQQKKRTNEIEVIPLWDHMVVSVALSTSCLGAALITPGIVSVVTLLGGICSSTLCFTAPALYRWKLHSTGVVPLGNLRETIICGVMLMVGVVGGVLGTGVALLHLIT